MDHALDVNPDIRILESIDALTTAVALRKERERVARDLLENGIVVSARERHGRQEKGCVPRHRDSGGQPAL